MALSYTTRLGLTKWGSSTDPFRQTQMNSIMDILEDKTAVFQIGTLAARPTAGATNSKSFWLTNDQSPNVLYYSNGTAWVALNAFGTASAQLPGDTATQGAATTYARSDHKHGTQPWGTVGQLGQVGTVASAGVVSEFARIDHVHTLANSCVTAGKIANGAINSSSLFTAGSVDNAALAGSINRSKLAADAWVPTGAILPFAGLTLPTGFLWCDGGSYSTTTYADLFAVVQYRYGGSGATFETPNLSGRAPLGATSVGPSATLGTTGGVSSVTLTTGNLPAHTHGVGTLATSNGGSHGHTASVSINNTNTAHTHGSGTLETTTSGSSHAHDISGESGLLDFIVQRNIGTINGYIGSSVTSLPISIRGAETVSTVSEGTHTHNVTGSTGSMSDNATHNHTGTVSVVSVADHTHGVTGSTASIGSGTSFSVQNPHETVNWIIKT